MLDAVLREMFMNPDRRLSFNELVRRVKSGDGAVARELKILIEAGLVVEQREGNQRFLAACKERWVLRPYRAVVSDRRAARSARAGASLRPGFRARP
jgi:DNA-binding transcriptional ArsR family regulator